MSAGPHVLPTLRAGFEGSGSPRWLMRTMQTSGLDRAHGFRLDLALLAEGQHRHGTLQALADGRVDVVDADRLALAAAQADGLPLTAICPYGRILGTLVLRRGYAKELGKQRIADLADHRLDVLRGRRFGVLSQQDKNWTLLAQACTELAGFDLAATVTPVACASRADLIEALEQGAVDAALVHWHLVPRLVAAGHHVLAELPALADALSVIVSVGLGGPFGAIAPTAAPTTFFVVNTKLATEQPTLVAAFVAATGAAVGRLRDDAETWGRLADEGAFAGAADAASGTLSALRLRWYERIGSFFSEPAHLSTPRSMLCNPF